MLKPTKRFEPSGTKQWYVDVIETGVNALEKSIEAGTREGHARHIERLINTNLNHELYHTELAYREKPSK